MKSIRCVRCNEETEFVGKKKFHEGMRLGWLGDLGELLVNREEFYLFICPACRHAAFFQHPSDEEPFVGYPIICNRCDKEFYVWSKPKLGQSIRCRECDKCADAK